MICMTRYFQFKGDGEHLWTRTWGSFWDISIAGIAVSHNGEILISGTYSQGVDFDPGEGEVYKKGDGSDLYLLLLDPNGEFREVLVWGSGYWTHAQTRGG